MATRSKRASLSRVSLALLHYEFVYDVLVSTDPKKSIYAKSDYRFLAAFECSARFLHSVWEGILRMHGAGRCMKEILHRMAKRMKYLVLVRTLASGIVLTTGEMDVKGGVYCPNSCSFHQV